MKSVGKIFTLMVLIIAVGFTSFNIYAQENNELENIEKHENEVLDEESLDDLISGIEKHKTNDLDHNAFENEESLEEIQEISKKEKETSFENHKGSVSRFLIYTSPEKYEYLSGEEILFYVGLSVTEDSGISEETVLEVSIPKKNIAEGTFIASDINSQVSKTIVDDEENYIVRYVLHPLKSGTSLDIPIKFKTLNGDTPNGFEMDANAKLMNNNYEEIIPSANQKFEIKTYNPSVSKFIRNGLTWTTNDNNVVSAGKESNDHPGYLSDDLEELESVEFSYKLFQTQNSQSNFGKRKYEKFIIKDKLPEGAVFIAADNPGWTYDKDTHTATYVYESPEGVLLGENYFRSELSLNLKFPAQSLSSTYTNSVEIESIPHNKPEYEDTYSSHDDIIFKLKPSEKEVPKEFIVSKSSSPWRYYDYQTDRDSTHNWRIKIGNPIHQDASNNKNLINVKMEDHTLDERLMYTGIEFNDKKSPIGSVKVSTVDVNGIVNVIKNDLDLSTSPYVEITDETVTRVIVEFNEATYLETGKDFEFVIHTQLRNKSLNVVPDNQQNIQLRNYADFTGEYVGGYSHSKSVSDYIRYDRINSTVTINKSIKNKAQAYFINDTISYELAVGASHFITNKTRVDVNQIVDILPDGVEYIEGSANITIPSYQHINTEMATGTKSFSPTVIPNYKGSGKTALVWEIKPFSLSGSGIRNVSSVYKIEYKTRITKLTKQGLNKNVAYLSWENNDDIVAYDKPIKDMYDLNNNGLTDDLITYDEDQFNYVPPKELIVQKEVKGSLNNNYILPPSFGTGEIGTEMSYQFTLFNNSVMDLSTLHVLDVLPIEHDETVSEDITLTPPSKLKRGSTFNLNLASEIEVPEGFKAYYTLDNIQDFDTEKEFYKNATWHENLEDYGAVTAFKIELSEGYIFKSGEEIQFDATFNVPNNKALDNHDKAVNSFAVATTDNLDFFESNLSTIEIVKYEIDGYVFEDQNDNHLFDSEDDVFKNYKVILEDADGNIVYDHDGNVLETYTDSEGYYSFDIYREGNYRVKVVTPDRYLKVNQTTPDVKYGSHTLDNTVEHTDTFYLNQNNRKETRNSGYFRLSTDFTVEKVWVNGPDVYPAIEVQLYRNGEVYGDPVTLENGTTSYTWLDLDKKDSDGVEYVYTVDELTDLEHYTKEVEGNTITNTYVIPKTDFTVEKVWVDGPNVHPTIEVQLYRNGETYGDLISLENGTTSYTWTDLDTTDQWGNSYDYSVKEIDAPENYTVSYKDVFCETIKNPYPPHPYPPLNPVEPEYRGSATYHKNEEKYKCGVEITNTYVSPRTDFTVEKVWVDGPKVHPAIEVQLYRNGETYGDPVSLENGITSYTWLDLDQTDSEGIAYVYTVDELTELEHYTKEVEGSTITNTYVSPKTDFTVEKVWVNGPDVHPTIEVQLYRNGEAYGVPVSLANGTTSYTWLDLDQTDSNGVAYVYTVDELTHLEDYIKEVDGNTIRNIYREKAVEEKPKEDGTPTTGLENNVVLYINLMLVSLLALLGMFISKKKRI